VADKKDEVIYRIGEDAELDRVLKERQAYMDERERECDDLMEQATILKQEVALSAVKSWKVIEKHLKRLGKIPQDYAVGKKAKYDFTLQIDPDKGTVEKAPRTPHSSDMATQAKRVMEMVQKAVKDAGLPGQVIMGEITCDGVIQEADAKPNLTVVKPPSDTVH
jgi:hypothetical protein